ncbi:hypothetical protein LMG33818_000051 [Halomonadaceae bacterium LMG 33818]|uniref:hypothetical protein n=1 Tax=Cernens ardua TaxID=3402176 RepID=UPI003EDC13F0
MSNIILNRVQREAGELRNKRCLYCIFFSHGIMKVGRTTNMAGRLDAILSHGLLNDLLVDAVFIAVGRDTDIAKAEAQALRKFSKTTHKHSQEVFSSINRKQAEKILIDTVAEAPKNTEKPKTNKDFHEVAKSCGMYRALMIIAAEKAQKMGMHSKGKEIEHMLRTFDDDQIAQYMQSLSA